MPSQRRSDLIESLLDSLPISEVARKLGFNILQRGHRFSTNCPWHEDRRPSLALNDRPPSGGRPYCHCFVCNSSGDAIDLVRQKNNLDFWEAVRFIAEIAGRSAQFDTEVTRKSQAKTKGLAREHGLELAFKHFKAKSDFQKVIDWAETRRIPAKVLEEAQVMWVFPRPITSERTKKWGREDVDALLEAGILRRSFQQIQSDALATGHLDYGITVNDFFYEDRVVFPIRDKRGKLQGFAGRLAKSDDNAPSDRKYVYTPGFRRSEALFRVDRVYNLIKELTPKRTPKSAQPFHLFIVEGFMDALRLESLGLDAVAVLGSSLASAGEASQSTVLKGVQQELASRGRALALHLFLDQDRAGYEGMLRALPPLLKLCAETQSMTVDVVDFKGGATTAKDPDELLQSYESDSGSTTLARLKARIVSPLHFALRREVERFTGSPEIAWETLSPIEKATIRLRIQQALSAEAGTYPPGLIGQTAFHEASQQPDWLAAIEESFVTAKQSVEAPSIQTDSDAFSQFRERHLHALRVARQSAALKEFPGDPATWDRLERGHDLFVHFQWESLFSGKQIEPYHPVLIPRSDGGQHRLKVLPCPEDLSLQTYYILTLLDYFRVLSPFYRYIAAGSFLICIHAASQRFDFT